MLELFEALQELKESDYKGYGIDHNIYGQGEYSVQVDGDDMMFKSEDEAKKFIDELPKEDQLTEAKKEFEATRSEVEYIIDEFLFEKCHMIDWEKDDDGYTITVKPEVAERCEMMDYPIYITFEEFKDDDPERNIIEVSLKLEGDGMGDAEQFDNYFNYNDTSFDKSKANLLGDLESMLSDESIENAIDNCDTYESFNRKNKGMKKIEETVEVKEQKFNDRLIADYRRYAGLKDGDEITEDLNDWALNCVSSRSNFDKEDLKDLLLKRGE